MLSKEDIQSAADLLQCEIAAIRAVIEVESAGSGFFCDGRPKILFEAHIFSKLTQGKYDMRYPTISSKTWNRNLYYGGPKEYERLDLAASLNRGAALQSASWGLFQIMGFNFMKCGFYDLQEFINAMYRSEKDQLLAFCKFIKSKSLQEELQSKNWKEFAFRYNGSGYAQNRYDEKLEAAYNKYRGKA